MTARARRAAPVRRAPPRAPVSRPALRVVRPGEPAPRGRQRRAATVGLLFVVAAFAVLFALAVFQTVLAQNQLRLDRLDREVAEEQARYQRLRLQVAQLEAPERIVAVAQERLGMVPPPGVRYLSPSGAVADEIDAAGADGEAPVPQPDGDASRTRTWAAVKPHLGGG